jgi:hypothetical protein
MAHTPNLLTPALDRMIELATAPWKSPPEEGGDLMWAFQGVSRMFQLVVSFHSAASWTKQPYMFLDVLGREGFGQARLGLKIVRERPHPVATRQYERDATGEEVFGNRIDLPAPDGGHAIERYCWRII